MSMLCKPLHHDPYLNIYVSKNKFVSTVNAKMRPELKSELRNNLKPNFFHPQICFYNIDKYLIIDKYRIIDAAQKRSYSCN